MCRWDAEYGVVHAVALEAAVAEDLPRLRLGEDTTGPVPRSAERPCGSGPQMLVVAVIAAWCSSQDCGVLSRHSAGGFGRTAVLVLAGAAVVAPPTACSVDLRDAMCGTT
jgi:hypothetical protein